MLKFCRDSSGRSSCRPPVLRRSPLRTGIAMLLLAIQLGGCFRYVPVSTVQPGSLVTVGITDRGRVGLADSLGPGVRRISGQLLAASDDRYVIAVHSVEFMDVNVPVRIERDRFEVPRDYVGDVRQREMSRSRTILAGVLVVAGLVIASLVAISGFGGDDPSDRPNGPGGGDTQ
jgi:hypothetical protein